MNNEDVRIVLYALSEVVAARLRKSGFLCSELEIYVKDCSFFSYTRRRMLNRPTDITSEIALQACSVFLLSYEWRRPVRSLGVRALRLSGTDVYDQLDMFSDEMMREKLRKMDRTVDNIRGRYGYYSLRRGIMYKDLMLSQTAGGLRGPKSC